MAIMPEDAEDAIFRLTNDFAAGSPLGRKTRYGVVLTAREAAYSGDYSDPYGDALIAIGELDLTPAEVEERVLMLAAGEPSMCESAYRFWHEQLGDTLELAAGDVDAATRRSLAAKGHALPDGSYPIPDKAHLHSAAVLAASGHGDVKAARALIRKRAAELGVPLESLPGFGSAKDGDEDEDVTRPPKGKRKAQPDDEDADLTADPADMTMELAARHATLHDSADDIMARHPEFFKVHDTGSWSGPASHSGTAHPSRSGRLVTTGQRAHSPESDNPSKDPNAEIERFARMSRGFGKERRKGGVGASSRSHKPGLTGCAEPGCNAQVTNPRADYCTKHQDVGFRETPKEIHADNRPDAPKGEDVAYKPSKYRSPGPSGKPQSR